MRIGILGTGTVAAALGEAWTRAGHTITVAGRSLTKAERLAGVLGHGAVAATPREAVTGRDAVLLAVTWTGVEDILNAADAPAGTLSGTPLIDPTNAVRHGDGTLLTAPGESMASRVAALAPGAGVVKAFHLFRAAQWTSPPGETRVTVPICGDDADALATVATLVRDTHSTPAVLGDLTRARQLEEVAGYVIALAFAGTDPNATIPRAG